MDETIDMRSPLSRANWCGNFACTDAELANAVRVMATTQVGLIGLYLATRSSAPIAGHYLDVISNSPAGFLVPPTV